MESAGEWLSVREAAKRLELTVSGVKECIYRGELEGQIRHRPERGRPPLMVRATEVERFIQSRGAGIALPAECRELILPLAWAAKAARMFPERLRQAARRGELRAVQLEYAGGQQPRWHVRLGDVEAYLTRRTRKRRHATRIFDPVIIAQLGRLTELKNGGPSLEEERAAGA